VERLRDGLHPGHRLNRDAEENPMSDIVQRISAAFEVDRVRVGIKVTRAEELPQRFEDLTPEWLTAVLCAGHPGARVESFRIVASDAGSSNRARLVLEYNGAGRDAGLPEALFCKASQDLANRIVLGVSGGAHVESTFYNHIRPHLTIEAPRGWFAHYDPVSFNSIILLGDLSGSVTEFCSHRTRMTRERVESQVRLLARVHGDCHARPELRAAMTTLATWPEYFTATGAFGIRDGSNAGFLAAEAVIPPAVFKRHAQIWDATVASVDAHRQLPPTLAHGDVHLKNWYVAGSGEMGLSDWQCASRGHWSRDLAYTVATALTVEDRRAWERELIALYLDQLARTGGAALDFDTAFRHYRQQLLSALTWWTITMSPAPGLPDMQPRDITLEFIRRITTAIDDLGSLDI
jgi:hypothetical protein